MTFHDGTFNTAPARGRLTLKSHNMLHNIFSLTVGHVVDDQLQCNIAT